MLAKKSGVSQSRINYLLNYKDANDRHPSTAIVEQLASAFSLEAWQLLCPTDAHSKPDPVDGTLLATALAAAFAAFRRAGRSPTDEALAAASVFVYQYICDGHTMTAAAKQADRLLDKIKGDEGAVVRQFTSARKSA